MIVLTPKALNIKAQGIRRGGYPGDATPHSISILQGLDTWKRVDGAAQELVATPYGTLSGYGMVILFRYPG